MDMKRKIYIEPFTGVVQMECPAYTCRAKESGAVDPAPMRQSSAPSVPINIMYI